MGDAAASSASDAPRLPADAGPPPTDAAAAPTNATFRTGFEPSDRQPTWTDTLATAENVAGVAPDDRPRCGVAAQKPHVAHTGNRALAFAGTSSGAGRAVFRLFDVGVPVGADTRLDYWVRAEDAGGARVAIELLFADGSTLLGMAGARDFRDCALAPAEAHCDAATPKAWTQIDIPIGQWAAGKMVREIQLVFQGGAGTFSGLLDDLFIGPRAPACLVDRPALDVGLGGGFRVFPIFLAASDAVASDTERRRDSFERAMRGIQRWYSASMGPEYQSATFQFEPVRVLASKFTRAQWDEYGAIGFLLPDGTRNNEGTGACGMWYAARGDLIANGLLRAAALPAIGSRGVIYVVVGGGGVNGSCGGGGLAASEAKLLDDVRTACPSGRFDACATDCRAVGAIAHELGHAFGLPHGMERATGCTGRSLMDAWWEYDRPGGATLCTEDRKDLSASGYFAEPRP
jgi:hypothetical protein